MSSLTCPYCKATNAPAATECGECQTAFPWVSAVAKLKDELKEREVNRGRATFTLIDEVFGAAMGGKPVSVAALKGFAFAWLFPRALIVVGSVITGVTLIIQTVILFQQSKLLRDQTAAAQYSQAEALRAQVVATERVLQSLQTIAGIAREARAAAGNANSTIACKSCNATTFSVANSQMGSDVGEAAEKLQTHLAMLERFAVRLTQSDGATRPEPSTFLDTSLEAHSRCGFPLASARRLNAYYSTILRLWDSPSVPPDAPPVAREVPTWTNFDAFMDPSPERDPSTIGSLLASSTTVDAFIERSLSNMSIVALELDASAASCTRRLLVDRALLLSLERSINPDAFDIPTK